MSTGKRLAKRSILGTRVVAPGEDGLYYPAVIQAVKNQSGPAENSNSMHEKVAGKYSVRFDLSRKVKEYAEAEIIGPGFSGMTGIKLRPGQIVYVTYCNREMQGSVVCHRPNIDQVIVRLLNGGPEVKKKLEEVRLLESRKSARLIGHGNTDFSKLADFNIVHERKRLNSETSDMSSGTTSGRKRRGSDTLSDSSDEGDYGFSWSSSEERSATPVMSECTAAMVLMNLSHAQMASKEAVSMQQRMMQFMHRGNRAEDTQNSPQDLSTTSLLSTNSASPPIQDGSSSPLSSTSGASSLGSSWTPFKGQQLSSPSNGGSSRATPISIVSQQQVVANLTEAEALLQLSNCQESDEGIVSDQSSVTDPEDPTAKRFKTEHVRIIYQCTWPRCGIKMDICSDMERHVRSQHLMKQKNEEQDLEGEEEFYYTEIEVPLVTELPSNNILLRPKSLFSSSAPSNSSSASTAAALILQNLPSNLADHMNMARPPHENPEYNFHQNSSFTVNTRPAHHQPRRPLPPMPPPAFSSITAAVPIAIPVTNLAFARSAPPAAHNNSHPHGLPGASASPAHHGKYIRLSPKPSSAASSSYNSGLTGPVSSAMAAPNLLTLQQQQVAVPPPPPPPPPPATATPTVKSSPIRRPRGDAKKCRKVYGMDHRDLWCTQCKWKKACTRFGEVA